MQITDLGNFIKAVHSIVDDWTLPGADWYPMLWFRGHGDANWTLEPGQYRLPPPGDSVGADWYNERTLLSEFKFRAPLYLPFPPPQTDWEWLFVMQHYGLPTRLLDWTESSLIALYFALRDNAGRSDAVVWVLNPWWLNKQSLGEFEIPHAGDARLNDWAPEISGERPVHGVLPVAIKPLQASPRIRSQKGFFTIHGTEHLTLDRIASSVEASGGLRRLTIPRRRVADMKRDLSMAGITETTIFPELEGLCREIKAWFCG
jgi:hypothetical protein